MARGFFEDEGVEDLAQAHIEEIARLEDREAERILKVYRRVRQDLRDRLDALEPGTFTAQQARGALIQVEAAIQRMSELLKEEMESSAGSAAEKGLEHLVEELKKYNRIFKGAAAPINMDVVRVAADTSNFLINQYEASLQAYSEFTRARIAQGLTQSAIEQVSMGEVVNRIGRTFLGEEWKLHRIVRTELHNVYGVGKLNGMKELWGEGQGTIPDLKKTLFHPMDHRTGKDSKRLAQNNPIVPIDEPFVETSTGKKLVYMAPPNRPNDRAILIPYRDSWKN